MATIEVPDTSVAQQLSDLWADERCGWELRFEPSYYGNDEGWYLDLEWTDEHYGFHQADFATFTWRFYGPAPDDVLAEAVQWCEELLYFERCSACDGEGVYGPLNDLTKCEECGTTGLSDRARERRAEGTHHE